MKSTENLPKIKILTNLNFPFDIKHLSIILWRQKNTENKHKRNTVNMLQLIQNKYKVLLEQGFLPILVADGVDALFEVEAAVNAGFKAVEFTLRRPDARVMIPEIRKRFPDLLLLVGSVLDAPKVVKNLQHKNPQLMLVEELADCGVDGLVSMLDFSDETIAKYQNQMLLMPAAATPAEGLRLFEKGVHFIKVITPYLPTINSLTAAPSFNFAPLLVTGGMNLETIPTPFADMAKYCEITPNHEMLLCRVIDLSQTAGNMNFPPISNEAVNSSGIYVFERKNNL